MAGFEILQSGIMGVSVIKTLRNAKAAKDAV
jgi:hypothetical protein